MIALEVVEVEAVMDLQVRASMEVSCTERVERELRTQRRKEGRREEKDGTRGTGLEVDGRAGSLARREEDSGGPLHGCSGEGAPVVRQISKRRQARGERDSAAGEVRWGSAWRRARAWLKPRWTWAATRPVSGEAEARGRGGQPRA